MNDIKYYILAYAKLIQLFLEKYTTFIYLLLKAEFTHETKNIDIFYDQIKDMDCRLERRSLMPNSVVHEIYSMGYQKALFNVAICTTNKYILIQLRKVTDVFRREYGYENGLKRIIFSERNLNKEKSGRTMYDMVSKNIEYYFKKKNSIVYCKQYNNNGRCLRFIYRIK